MARLTIEDANPEFSALIDRVLRGEEIVFVRAGQPVVRLVPAEAPPIERRPGRGRGQIVLSADFDGPLHAEFGAAFGLGEG